MEGLLAFVLAGLALTGSPGPATLSLAATGAALARAAASSSWPESWPVSWS